jgi:hypothetical protein
LAADRRSGEQTFADEMTRRAGSGEPRHPHATHAAVPPNRPAAGDPVLARTVATRKAAPADTRSAPDTGGAAAGALLDSKLDSLNTRLAGIRNAAGLTTEVRSELQGLTSWINRFRRGQITGALSREQRENVVRAASAKIQEVRGRIQRLLNQDNARPTFLGAPIISVDPSLPPDFPPFSQVQMARLEALRDALTGLPGVDRHEPEAMPPTATAGGNGGVTLASTRTPAQAAPAAAAAQPDDPAVVAAANKIKRLVKRSGSPMDTRCAGSRTFILGRCLEPVWGSAARHIQRAYG